MEEYYINKSKKILNMDKFKAYINYSIKEIMIVLIEIKEFYIFSLKNRKLITIIEIIRRNKKKTFLLYIIILR